MGFSEDERIRAKNHASNKAYELFEDLKSFGYDTAYIQIYAEFALQATTCSIRNEIYSRLISIVKGVANEKKHNLT